MMFGKIPSGLTVTVDDRNGPRHQLLRRPKSIEPNAQLAIASGTRGSAGCGVKLVTGPLKLIRLPEAHCEVMLDALMVFPIPEAKPGI